MNPYAPPAIQDEAQRDILLDGLVWRDGDLMVIRSGAALPRRCFVTGKETMRSVTINQLWQPSWVQLWLLAGIIPYFLVSPFYARRAKLTVPISPAVYESHLRKVNVGFAMILGGIVIVVSAVLYGNVFLLTSLVSVIGVLSVLVGCFISSRQPITLEIVNLEGDLLTLKNVHADCLLELPSVESANGMGTLNPHIVTQSKQS